MSGWRKAILGSDGQWSPAHTMATPSLDGACCYTFKVPRSGMKFLCMWEVRLQNLRLLFLDFVSERCTHCMGINGAVPGARVRACR